MNFSLETAPSELTYVILIFALFVVPKVVERIRVPAGVVALGLGALASIGFELFRYDATIPLLATLGITSLFLFAGLEIEFPELYRNRRILIKHVIIGVVFLLMSTLAVQKYFELSFQVACLYALALVTPSTGFIIDSLPSFGLTDDQKFWVKTKAISTEIVALAVMFFMLQSTSLQGLGISILGLAAVILALPVLFHIFARMIAPYAPHSEFAFFLMLAVLCGLWTKRLGAYYLVGAFFVGVAIQRFRHFFSDMDTEKTLHALRLFSSFFIPFYFFNAGLKLTMEEFSLRSILIGLSLVIIVTPFRLLTVIPLRKYSLRETLRESATVAGSLLPTLVFGLVIAGILRSRFGISDELFGALITYTVVISAVPGFIFKVKVA